MRYVVLLLILANLGVFAWRQWVYTPVEPEPTLAAGVVELEIAPLQPETVFTPLPVRIFPDLELPSFGQIPQAGGEEDGSEAEEDAEETGAEGGSSNDDGFEEEVLEEGLEEENLEEDLEDSEIEEDAGAEIVEDEGGAEPVEAQGEVQE